MRVLRIDEKLAAVQKPQLQPVRNLSLDSHDCLILCAGFEERVMAALNSALLGERPFKVIVVDYLPFLPQNRSEIIREKCIRHGLELSAITYDRQNPAGFGEVLVQTVANCDGRSLRSF